MGEASKNPRSIQYKGPMAENEVRPYLAKRITPSGAWLEANPDVDPEKCPVEEMEMVFILAVDWRFPSALNRNRPDKWPGAQVPVAELCREKVTVLHRRVAMDMRARGEVAPPLTGDEEPGGPPPAEPDPEAS